MHRAHRGLKRGDKVYRPERTTRRGYFFLIYKRISTMLPERAVNESGITNSIMRKQGCLFTVTFVRRLPDSDNRFSGKQYDMLRTSLHFFTCGFRETTSLKFCWSCFCLKLNMVYHLARFYSEMFACKKRKTTLRFVKVHVWE